MTWHSLSFFDETLEIKLAIRSFAFHQIKLPLRLNLAQSHIILILEILITHLSDRSLVYL